MTGRQDEAYLLGLRLRGRRVVVVGGGAVAARRVPRLLAAGADVLLVSPEATPALAELAAAGRLDWRQRPYENGDCRGAWLVCACAGQPDVNAKVAEEAEARTHMVRPGRRRRPGDGLDPGLRRRHRRQRRRAQRRPAAQRGDP